jgi:Holliday junction resolvase
MKEQAIQNKIIKNLNDAGFYCAKIIAAGKKGVPDILACIHGVFVGLEVKTEKGKATPLQNFNLAKIRDCGGKAAIVRSWEDVIEIIKEIENEKRKCSGI